MTSALVNRVGAEQPVEIARRNALRLDLAGADRLLEAVLRVLGHHQLIDRARRVAQGGLHRVHAVEADGALVSRCWSTGALSRAAVCRLADARAVGAA
jgi:hypothetical protein